MSGLNLSGPAEHRRDSVAYFADRWTSNQEMAKYAFDLQTL